MEKLTENEVLQRLAVIETQLKNEVIDELKEMRLENKENAKNYIELNNKVKDAQADIQLLKLQVENLKSKWDTPTKIMVSVMSAIAVAILSLILK